MRCARRVRFVPENWINDLHAVDGQHPGLVHQPPALVGPSHPGVVRRGRQHLRRRRRSRRVARRTALGAGRRVAQDDDVLDTWFSSALWPFSTLGWPDEARATRRVVANFDDTLPAERVLVTGFDIIFFWVARMIMATQYFTGEVPFRDVYINALVRDAEGQKMSKSKGNILDPLDLIDGIALDALVPSRTGSLLIPQMREKIEKRTRKELSRRHPGVRRRRAALHVRRAGQLRPRHQLRPQRAEGYKNFCNKLWNAARFVLMNYGRRRRSPAPPHAA